MARMWGGFHRFVHEGINHISNVEVHLKTRSRIVTQTPRMMFKYGTMIAWCLDYNEVTYH